MHFKEEINKSFQNALMNAETFFDFHGIKKYKVIFPEQLFLRLLNTKNVVKMFYQTPTYGTMSMSDTKARSQTEREREREERHRGESVDVDNDLQRHGWSAAPGTERKLDTEEEAEALGILERGIKALNIDKERRDKLELRVGNAQPVWPASDGSGSFENINEMETGDWTLGFDRKIGKSVEQECPGDLPKRSQRLPGELSRRGRKERPLRDYRDRSPLKVISMQILYVI